jgi:hypothetical protein
VAANSSISDSSWQIEGFGESLFDFGADRVKEGDPSRPGRVLVQFAAGQAVELVDRIVLRSIDRLSEANRAGNRRTGRWNETQKG